MNGEKVSDRDDEAEMAATQWELDVDQDDPEVDVAEIVAELEDTDPADLRPTYDTIDSLIEQLFSDPPPPEAQAMIQFTYGDYRIDIQQSGHATFMNIAEDG